MVTEKRMPYDWLNLLVTMLQHWVSLPALRCLTLDIMSSCMYV